MNSSNELWNLIKDYLKNYCKENLNETIYTMWFECIELVSLKPDCVIIAAPRFKIDFILNKYLDVVKEAFQNVMGFDIEIKIIPTEDIPKEQIIDEEENNEIVVTDVKITGIWITSDANNSIRDIAIRLAKENNLPIIEVGESIFN